MELKNFFENEMDEQCDEMVSSWMSSNADTRRTNQQDVKAWGDMKERNKAKETHVRETDRRRTINKRFFKDETYRWKTVRNQT